MPHLSPMNWIMAILLFWLSLALASSKSWWSQLASMPFITPSINKMNKKMNSWKWNW